MHYHLVFCSFFLLTLERELSERGWLCKGWNGRGKSKLRKIFFNLVVFLFEGKVVGGGRVMEEVLVE